MPSGRFSQTPAGPACVCGPGRPSHASPLSHGSLVRDDGGLEIRTPSCPSGVDVETNPLVVASLCLYYGGESVGAVGRGDGTSAGLGGHRVERICPVESDLRLHVCRRWSVRRRTRVWVEDSAWRLC